MLEPTERVVCSSTAAAQVVFMLRGEMLAIDGESAPSVHVEEAYAQLQRADRAPVNQRVRGAGDMYWHRT